jgi:hypothetical protein
MVAAVGDVVALVVVVGFCGHGGGHSGGQGGGGNDKSNFINGVDVSDPTQNLTDEEWRKLAYNGGRLYVAQA